MLTHRPEPPLAAERGNGQSPAKAEAIRLRLRCFLSPGDILMLTAAVRDLHRAHPGRFLTEIESSCSELWDHNPHVTAQSGDPVSAIDMEYPLINESNSRPYHFIHAYHKFLEQRLGVQIPPTDFRGDIHLSAQEKAWTNQVEEHFGFRGPYWIMIGGGKYDFTAKWWPPRYYQEVVDRLEGKVQFVQCGAEGHWHPRLRGALDLVGRTSLRQFVRLMFHAEGVVCPVTFAMHLAAAVEHPRGRLRPAVVIAGGREPPHWEAYPGHQFLHTIGSLPCCERGGCWKSRCQRIGDKDLKDNQSLCERPVPAEHDLYIPQCMMKVTPDDVIRAMERCSS